MPYRSKGLTAFLNNHISVTITINRNKRGNLMRDHLDSSLETKFQAACESSIFSWREKGFPPTGRPPTTWIKMIHQYGASEAARRILECSENQSGFGRLIEIGHPEWTVEWEVLNPKWRPLFNEVHLEAARWRLKQVRVAPPS